MEVFLLNMSKNFSEPYFCLVSYSVPQSHICLKKCIHAAIRLQTLLHLSTKSYWFSGYPLCIWAKWALKTRSTNHKKENLAWDIFWESNLLHFVHLNQAKNDLISFFVNHSPVVRSIHYFEENLLYHLI